MNEHITITVAAVFLIAIACQWLAWPLKLPAIIFLLLAGTPAGPLTGWLGPDALSGDLFFPFVSLSVAIILFEGSLTLKFHQIRGLQHVVQNILTVGMLASILANGGDIKTTKLTAKFGFEDFHKAHVPEPSHCLLSMPGAGFMFSPLRDHLIPKQAGPCSVWWRTSKLEAGENPADLNASFFQPFLRLRRRRLPLPGFC